MIEALKCNSGLEYIHIHDNWLKEEAIKEFSSLLKSLNSLKSINISDCDIGGAGVKKIVRALGVSKNRETIEYFGCNYNDVERSKTAKFIFNVFSLCPNLKEVSFIGHDIKGKLKTQFKEEFANLKRILLLEEPTEDDEEEEDIDEDEEISEDEEDESDSEEEAKDLLKQFENLKIIN